MTVIYKITSPSGKLYVGKTYDLRKRVNCHKCATRKGSSVILHNSIRKYGWDAHKLEIIEEVTEDLLNEREIFWIAELKTYCYDNPMGLNMTKGGDGQRTTWMHDLARRKHASETRSGVNASFYGKKHTDEAKKAMSEKTRKRHLENGTRIPEWGVQKGRLIVMVPIVAYDSNGMYVGDYLSARHCAEALGLSFSSVSSAVYREKWAHGKYFFKIKNGDIQKQIDVRPVTIQCVKRPLYILSDDFEIIAEYPSAKEASDFWGIPRGSINRNAMEFRYLRTGHNFMYKDIFEEFLKAA